MNLPFNPHKTLGGRHSRYPYYIEDRLETRHINRDREMVWHLWKAVWQFFRRLSVEFPCGPAVPLPEVCPRGLDTRVPKAVYTNARGSVTQTAKEEKWPKCPSVHECYGCKWNPKMDEAECYSDTKRNKVLVHAITWMNLENMLQRKKPNRKATQYKFHLHEGPGQANPQGRSRPVVAKGWGNRGWRVMGTGFFCRWNICSTPHTTAGHPGG